MVLLGGLASCGGEDGPKTARESIVAPDLSKTAVTRGEIERSGNGTVDAAFLQYWWLLQYQAFSDVVTQFDPALVRVIGADTMVEAFKSQTAYYRGVRPRIVSRYEVGRTTTVTYVVADSGGAMNFRSTRFERRDGRWQIVYDAFLDSAIRQSVQDATQASIDPNAAKPSRQAVAAGIAAASCKASTSGLGRAYSDVTLKLLAEALRHAIQ